jgi:hypothetical protein
MSAITQHQWYHEAHVPGWYCGNCIGRWWKQLGRCPA